MLELKEEAERLGTEMNSGLTGSHRATAQLTSTKPDRRGNRWQQQFGSDNDSCAGWVQVAGFRDHNLRGAF